MQAVLRTWAALFVVLLALVSHPLHAADKPDFMVDADWLAAEMTNPKLVLPEVR